MFKQLLNCFYELGFKKSDEYSIYKLANLMKGENGDIKKWGKKILNYIHSDVHKYIRNYLRNRLTHSINPNSMSVFHEFDSDGFVKPDIDFMLPGFPLEELDKILQDTVRLVDMVCSFNIEIKKIFEETILVKPKIKLNCNQEYQDIEVMQLKELKEVIKKGKYIVAQFEKCKDCINRKEHNEVMVCDIISLNYSRIHENENEIILF